MEYYSDLCDKFIKPKSKYKHFKSNTYEEFDECKHIELTIENLDINNVTTCFTHTLIDTIKNMTITLLNVTIN